MHALYVCVVHTGKDVEICLTDAIFTELKPYV